MITQSHIKALELDKVLELAAAHARCRGSAEIIKALVPVSDFDACVRAAGLTSDADTLAVRFGSPPINKVEDCAEDLKKAAVGSRLGAAELLEINRILSGVRMLKRWQATTDGLLGTDFLFEELADFKAEEDRIASVIISEEEISDRASGELAAIRQKMRTVRQSIRTRLEEMTRSSTYQKYLQESIITLRNGRFVVPVKSEYRGEVKGMIHDTSSSGATVFIEPMAVVEANNELRLLEQKELEEINRILYELSGAVGNRADEIMRAYELTVQIDALFAKVRYGHSIKAFVPTIGKDGIVELKKARHPLIAPEHIVPTDVWLGGEFDTLVITGPNTGGKTVVLKTVGLLTLMMMCGLPVPTSEGSRLSVFDRVFADIGEEQSIEQSLSTFSAHMTNVVGIVNAVTPKSLVLLDELGAGTDPAEGAALAVSILERFKSVGAKTVATTHYPEIKMYALDTDRVENASCEFDVATLRPTYRLLIGVPGRSNAFAISERLGLDVSLIQNAKNYVSPENSRLEDIVSELENTRIRLEQEKLAAQMLTKELVAAKEEAKHIKSVTLAESEKELERAKAKARTMVEDVKFTAGKLLDEIEEIKNRQNAENFGELAQRARRSFNAGLAKLYDTADPVVKREFVKKTGGLKIKKGDNVYCEELGANGIAIADEDGDGNVRVRMGAMQTKLSAATLSIVKSQKKQVYKNAGVSVTRASKSDVSGRKGTVELDLRGQSLDQALIELERFIDSSVMSGIKIVTIIHGKGTGVLRAGIADCLRSNKSVEKFRLGTFGEGESGVTIAELV